MGKNKAKNAGQTGNSHTNEGGPKKEAHVAPITSIESVRCPDHAIKVSQKRGMVFVHVNLPRGVPSSVINLDARQTGFHLDTGKWGGGYILDVPWPEGIKVCQINRPDKLGAYCKAISSAHVHLKEGEEAEAELAGGKLKVCFRIEGAQQQVKKPNAVAASKNGGDKKNNVKASGQAASKGGQKAATGKAAPEKQKGDVGAKRERDSGVASSEEDRNKNKKKKKLVDSKDVALKLVDDVSGKEEGKIQEKLEQESERLQRQEEKEQKREERRMAKKNKKQALVERLKKDKKLSKTKGVRGKGEGDAEEDGEDGGGGDGEGDAVGGKKRRVSWGTDQVRKFHS